MNAAIFHQFGEPSEVIGIGEKTTPEPGNEEVRVRMLASPVNPSDIMTIRGKYGMLPSLPATPGFEGVGIIDQLGPGWLKWLRRLSIGQKVAVLNPKGSNWQEYVVLSAKNVVPVGDMNDANAASFFVNPATAIVMTLEVLKMRSGQWLIQTAGGSALGQMVVRLGKKFGFHVINLVRREEQAEEMRQNGHHAFSTTEANIPDKIKSLCQGAHHAIDAVGGDMGRQAFLSLRPKGKMLVYGVLSGEDISVDPRALLVNETSLQGFWLSEWVKQQSILKLLSLFSKIRKFTAEGITSTNVQEYHYSDIAAAVKEAERPGRTKKVMVRFSEQ